MWLTEVPTALVQAHLTMLPRLEAEETLARSSAIGLALSDGEEAKSQRARLVAAASGPQPEPEKPVLTGDEKMRQLQALPFPVRRVPLKQKRAASKGAD